MIYPKQNSGDQGSANPVTFSPLPIIHIIGNFMRIWSVYSMYHYLSQTGASVVLFIFTCLAPSAVIFLALQQPWKGRPLSNTQVVPSIINGGITALYFILWGKGLKSCGPVRAIMAEYSGAVLVLSAVLYGRTGHVWKKITYGFLFSKAFNGCWRMHHYYGDCVQNGFFCTGLFDLLHNFGLWDISSNIFGTFYEGFFAEFRPIKWDIWRPNSVVFTTNLKHAEGEYLSQWERSTNSVFPIPSNSEVLAAELIDRADGKIGQWLQILMPTSSLISVVQRLKTCWISLSWLKRWLSEVWGTTQGTSIVF